MSINEGSPIPKLHREAPAGGESGFLLNLHFKGCLWCINKMGRALKINAYSWPTAGCLIIIEAPLHTLKVCLNDRKLNTGQDTLCLSCMLFLYYGFKMLYLTPPYSVFETK